MTHPYRLRFRFPCFTALFVLAMMAPVDVMAYNWLQFNGDPQHGGNNTREATITADNVGRLEVLFQVTLPGVADGAPVYLSDVKTPGGTKDLLFVNTKPGDLLALDAKTGSQVWSRRRPDGSCMINRGSRPCITTSSPAIDPGLAYIYSYTPDGYVHKYRVEDGAEVTGGSWPQVTTLKPFDEKGSSDLAVATAGNGVSYLYIANSGYLGDRGDYQGHLTVVNLSDGSQTVFNALCSNQPVHFREEPAQPDCPQVRAGIWARAGVVYDQGTDRIYAATGNGIFGPAFFDWGDTVMALNPDGSGAHGYPLDSYTPTDHEWLRRLDLDLGSTAPAILPVPPGSSIPHLGVQGGKDAKLRLLDLDNLSGQHGPGHVGGDIGTPLDLPQAGEILTAPAVWVNPADGATWVYVANGNGISGMRLTLDSTGLPGLNAQWRNPQGGTSPIVANGVLFYAGAGGIRALDPATGNRIWSSARIGPIHWESPIVTNAVLYITDENARLTAYSIDGAPR